MAAVLFRLQEFLAVPSLTARQRLEVTGVGDRGPVNFDPCMSGKVAGLAPADRKPQAWPARPHKVRRREGMPQACASGAEWPTLSYPVEHGKPPTLRGRKVQSLDLEAGPGIGELERGAEPPGYPW